MAKKSQVFRDVTQCRSGKLLSNNWRKHNRPACRQKLNSRKWQKT